MTDPSITITVGSLENLIGIGTACLLTAVYVKKKIDTPNECLQAIKKRVDILYIAFKLHLGDKINFDQIEKDVNNSDK